MINIITTSLRARTRGPKKVVENLIKGLEKIEYPFIINGRLDATSQLYIHDDTQALEKIKDLPDYVRPIIGPNLFINPTDIPLTLSLEKSVYIHPSSNVISLWKKQGYNKSALDIWPVGVDTERYKPNGQERKNVILYFKNRTDEELRETESILKQKNISYELFKYGHYEEEDFRNALLGTRYVIWLGGFESQGLALEEALSSDVPVLLIDKIPSSPSEEGATAAPYWDDTCGLKISSIEMLEGTLEKMEEALVTFHPRNYIEEHLNLEKQARALVDLYQKHFGISFEQGKNETVRHEGRWRPSFWRKQYDRAKRFLRRRLV